MYGYQSSYPEDIKTYKKVKKFEDEFDKYNPEKNLLSEEEEEVEPSSFDKEVPLKEVEYGKKIDYMQMTRSNLTTPKPPWQIFSRKKLQERSSEFKLSSAREVSHQLTPYLWLQSTKVYPRGINHFYLKINLAL